MRTIPSLLPVSPQNSPEKQIEKGNDNQLLLSMTLRIDEQKSKKGNVPNQFQDKSVIMQLRKILQTII